MSNSCVNPVALLQAVIEARHQLTSGTDVEAMVCASDDLRSLDPENPLVEGLETRIRHAFQITFLELRAKLAARSGEID
jgi:hypothetical protein